jgi:hypothetical protein
MMEEFDINGNTFHARINQEVIIKFSGNVTVKGLTIEADDDCDDEQDVIDSLKEKLGTLFPELCLPAESEEDPLAPIVPRWMRNHEPDRRQLQQWNQGAPAQSPELRLRDLPIANALTQP